MPIKPDQRALYPAEWPAISAQVRKDARYRCQWPGCGARNYSVGWWRRGAGGAFEWVPLWGNDDNPRSYQEARQVAAEEHFARYGEESGGAKLVVIVLTVAHLDHDPTNCAPENLRAWCQRHHLAYDHAHHRANAFRTRRLASTTGDLFPL